MRKASMPKALKKRWLAALRSGRYKQGQGWLYDPESKSFCCLGVLEHVAMDGKVEVDVGYYDNDGGFLGMPTDTFFETYGCRGFELTSTPNVHHLVRMNDRGTTSFAEIADWIETNIEGT